MRRIWQKLIGTNSVKGASIILVVTLFLSNVLGLIRDRFLAQKIPTTTLDTYYAAFRIPDLIFNLLILGAITASFIPIFSKFLAKKEKERAWKVANSFLNISVIVIAIFLVILYFFMPQIIPLMVDFSGEKLELTIKLSRIILVSPLIFTISHIFGAILNSFKKFFIYSLAPLVYNLSIIIATVFFADKYGIYAVVYGVLVGALLHMLIQFIQLIFSGFKYQPIIDLKDKATRKIFKLMVPRAVGLGANQFMVVVYTSIASAISAGSVAIFQLADNMQTMPSVVFGISFATAVFPTLSEKANLKKYSEFTDSFFKSVRAIVYILIPVTLVFILLRAQIVRIVLGSGHFGWDDTIRTYNTLALFSISLVAQGLIPLLARGFYALHNTKIPTIISVISVVIGIAFGYILAPSLGVKGLALAFSIASFFNAVCLYLLLRKKIKSFREKEKQLVSFIFKLSISTAVMSIFIQLTKKLTDSFLNIDTLVGITTQLIISVLVAIIVYFFVAKWMGCEEQEELNNLLKRYLGLNNGKRSVQTKK